MRRLLCVAVLAGCYNPAAFQPCNTVCQNDDGCQPGFTCGKNGYCRPPDIGDCSPTQDSQSLDGPEPDLPPGTLCVGKGFIKNVCFGPDAMPINDITAPPLFDTRSECSMLITQAGSAPPICALVGRSFTLGQGATMRVIGNRPLAIITTMDITIAGAINASSLLAERGPNSGPAGLLLCSVSGIGQSATGAMDGGGGGAGGALTTAGGAAGDGAGGNAGAGVTATRMVSSVRGGCDGGRGGENAAGGTGGSVGFGGGAVYLLANGLLTVTGTVNASGSGAGVAMNAAGGGGGGSGGFIGLDAGAFSIPISARIYASGGSGSSGGGVSSDGSPGAIATPNLDPGFTPGSDGGGIGGGGSSVNMGERGEAGSGNSTGGGGGGGGAGFVGYAGPYNTSLTIVTVRPGAVLMP